MNIYINYLNNNLRELTNNIIKLFKENNYQVQQEIQDNTNFILLNSLGNQKEIIYPLQNNDTIAKELASKLNATKYYQQRSSINTNQNANNYFNQKDNFQGLIINFINEDLNNTNIPEIIFQVINNYLNNQNIYIVQSGDSLYSIAKKFKTSVDELKKINNLSSNSLSINQKLILPIINNDTEVNNNFYIVQSGDSLYSIAKKFKTSVDELKKINNLSSNNLSINQKLIISQTINDNTPANDSDYIVQSGDSLYSIAKKFKTSVDELKKINNLSSNNLSINQKLIIPSKNTYVVQSGDSLYAISKKFSTSVDELKKINNLTSNNLSINQKLIIP